MTRRFPAPPRPGVLATGLAFAMLAWAQQHMSAGRSAALCATEPLFAAIAAYVLLGEGLSGRACLGGLLIVASILVGAADLRAAWRSWRGAWAY